MPDHLERSKYPMNQQTMPAKSSTPISDETRRVTLKEVADHAGVSKSTVSLVLRNDSAVHENTRQLVLESIKNTGYVYNRRAASLREHYNRDSFALILHSLRSPFSSELLDEFERLSLAEKLLPIFSSNLDLVAQQEKQIQLYLEHGVAGLILCPASGTDPNYLNDLAARGLPIVQIMREVSGTKLPSVTADNQPSVAAATSHLIAAGHRHIAFIGGVVGDSDFSERYAGYQQAHRTANLPLHPEYCQPCHQSLSAGAHAAERILQAQPQITAVIAFTDEIAYGVTQACRKLGKVVSEDIALFGFDDIDFSSIIRPSISSISIDNAAMTRQAIGLLNRLIHGEAIADQSVKIKTTLHFRESTSGLRTDAQPCANPSY